MKLPDRLPDLDPIERYRADRVRLADDGVAHRRGEEVGSMSERRDDRDRSTGEEVQDGAPEEVAMEDVTPADDDVDVDVATLPEPPETETERSLP